MYNSKSVGPTIQALETSALSLYFCDAWRSININCIFLGRHTIQHHSNSSIIKK